MSRRNHRHPLYPVLAALLLLGVVPACTASGLGSPSPQGAQSDGSGNIVYRPVYPPRLLQLQPKTIYPGGYAGTVYPPLGTGRALNPTMHSTAPDDSCARPRSWLWWRR